jgi:hypothetical protein
MKVALSLIFIFLKERALKTVKHENKNLQMKFTAWPP